MIRPGPPGVSPPNSRVENSTRLVPVVGALLIVAAGLVMTAQALPAQ